MAAHQEGMTLTLRQKLFAAFTLAALLPTLGFGAMALYAASQLEAAMEQRFVDDARADFSKLQSRATNEEHDLDAYLAGKANEQGGLVDCTDEACYAAALSALKHPRAGNSLVGDRDDAPALEIALAVRTEDDGTILASDKPQSMLLPAIINPSMNSMTPSKGRMVEPFGLVSAPATEEWFVVPLHIREYARGSGEPALHAARQLLIRRPRNSELKSQRMGDLRIEFVGDGLEATPEFTGLEKSAPDVGKTSWLRGNDGVTYLAYSPVSWEDPAYFRPTKLDAQVFAAIPEEIVRAPARKLQHQAFAAMAAFFIFAMAIAFGLSRRFLRVTDQLKSGMQAIGRGEPVALEKLSQDELGGGLVDTINGMARDLAERGRRDEFENWKRVIRVLSHEINNTIAPVRSVAATLRERFSRQPANDSQNKQGSEDLREATTLIAERMDALGSFVGRFGELAKLPAPELQEIDLSKLVTSAARMFTEEANERNLVIELIGTDVRARVDPGQLERVVINLLKNAIEASASGQTVTIRTSATSDGALLEVEDAGSGISPEARSNLFVPSFSTKPGGSGVGLALARQIVVGHRGWITAEDRPVGGTLFRVTLPSVHDIDSAPAHR
jgi:signal transduction histidine kinase